jgi:hypothetical protein
MMDKAPESLVREMNIMDASGHKQLTWTTDSLEEIAEAQETFDNLMTKGYTAFGSKVKAEAKQSIKEFDPTLEELVLVPRTVGG